MNFAFPNMPHFKEVNGAKSLSAKSLPLSFPNKLHHAALFPEKPPQKARTADSARHPPVTKLETTSGKISIFSILIRISPGKAMIIMTSGGRGDMCRSSIPAMEPRKTPAPQKEREREATHMRYKRNKSFENRVRLHYLF